MCWLSFCNWLHSRKTPFHAFRRSLQSAIKLGSTTSTSGSQVSLLSGLSGHHHLKIFGKIMKWHFWNIEGHPSTNNIEVSEWRLQIGFFTPTSSSCSSSLNALLNQHGLLVVLTHLYTLHIPHNMRWWPITYWQAQTAQIINVFYYLCSMYQYIHKYSYATF